MTFTLWFMGRPASGKSTLAKRVERYLRDQGMTVENFDGDEVRQNLHPDLGFSRSARATNNRRTAFISKVLNRNGIPVVNAMITPFREAQREARDIIEPDGTFVLVYVKCSVEEASNRDPKGLYDKAKQGNIENFTGINHPFQEPHNPDIIVDTESLSIDESVEKIIEELNSFDLFAESPSADYSFEVDRAEEEEIKDRLADLGYLDET